jgi:hypothetical protein
MYRNMLQTAVYTALFSGVTVGLTACGGGGSSSGSSSSAVDSPPPVTPASVPLALSDASSEDWALIGVKVLSIALVPQGGGANVPIWTAPSPAPYVNLEQLDDLGELIGNANVTPGTYVGAVLTVSANPGDVLLTAAKTPEAGFPVAGGTSIPWNQIQIQNAVGASGSLTVPVDVNFSAPLIVSTSALSALDLEFDLANPAFIVGHTPPAAMGNTIWAVNFQGAVRHHPIWNLPGFLLRHAYGTVGSVSPDNSYFTMTKDFAAFPITNPEQFVPSSIALQIQADSTIGTIFYDVDAGTATVVKDFSAEAMTLPGQYVRVAARFQPDGTLVAVRVWASAHFNSVWLSPEGHVDSVDAANSIIYVDNEQGTATPVMVNSSTEFFYRTPANAQADATPIASGAGFLTSQQLVRGFKVHVSALNPLNTPLVAQTIDIENATYSGVISGASATALTYTHNYVIATDDYSVMLNLISPTTPNGYDGEGNAIDGFKWWPFTYPTTVMSGTTGINDFISATTGMVNFGGSVGAVNAWGASAATWVPAAIPTNPGSWQLKDAILMPTPVPLGTVTTGFAGTTFAMSAVGGTTPVSVNVSEAQQSATLVYQVDRTNGVVTVSSIDITTPAGQLAIGQNLTSGVPVKVYGVPEANASALQAYVIIYYTGTLPSQ